MQQIPPSYELQDQVVVRLVTDVVSEVHVYEYVRVHMHVYV